MESKFRRPCAYCLALVCTLVAMSTAMAEPPANPFRGKYRILLASGGDWDEASSMDFYLRSSGAVGKIKGKGGFKYGEVYFFLLQGSASEGPDPLSIGNLMITYGSDEETCEIIVRLARTKDWSDRATLKVVDAIQTFVDGPNDVDAVGSVSVTLERWNKETKAWAVVPE